ncbi:hypothetical protein Lesp02_72040 [Lentzea sp. NBRC 105346]|uniref:beta-ketoacyl synthase N-terminal-like domain-containing protein n=1 Tax=Lentzea sp. NBRC 105346 TaxID=3032205 RepID=UPI0024A1CEBB|nr:beta-ketoacyl synthase N-terminal-like domain-containing protein [Lentzea sp. NBRC 105346]GLZ35017.1 hypothetical protein Lesp02_72040 [Lentzea sp. NBRC 105346]
MKTRVRASAKLDGPVELPPVTGFVESSFNPLLYHVAMTCLAGQDIPGDRLGVVLVSLMGDATTTDLASERMVSGQVHNPLLFMQATANAVLGRLSTDLGITGPLLALSTTDDPAGELLAAAELLLAVDDLDAVLTLAVELAPNPRTARAHALLGTDPPAHDVAVAQLLEPHPEET